MIDVRQTETFSVWIDRLRDQRAVARIGIQIERMRNNNFGDVRPVGEGVSEMRIDYGPGYRIYFTRRGATIYLLLCGGDKSTQARDIRTAKRLAQDT